jgi:glycosyltransferase involved in cell wall biosynthesis
MGYQVTVVGGAFVPELKIRDDRIIHGKKWQYVKAYDLTQGGGPAFFLKIQKKVGELACRRIGLENRWQLHYGTGSLYRKAKELDADLTVAHWDAALPAAVKLLEEGKRVGVDMEDWFSEDLVPEARKGRPIRLLKKLEWNLLCHGAYSSCTSEAMADALVKEYGCRRPLVIRNVFPVRDRERLDGKWKDRPGMAKWMERNSPNMERPKEAPVSIHWFSQTVGPGRGLELLFQALEGMEGNWELHLRGNLKGYEGWLEQICPAGVRQRLSVHGMVENEGLLSRIAEHDIGYAGELEVPLSRNLTITNKFFQYLQAGLAVVASDTEGQKEAVQAAEGSGILVSPAKRGELKAALKKLTQQHAVLECMKKKAWSNGAELVWEKESRKLAAAIQKI